MFSIKFIKSLGLVCFLCLLLSIAAQAQSATATLSGAVVDSSGGLIPGASVTISNNATGLQRQTITNDEGNFTIPLLPPSNYTVTVQRDGFAPAEIREVILNVGDQRSLRIQLTVGQVSGTVTVTGQASLVDEAPAVGTVVDRQLAENMPLNGRSFNALLELTPGTVLTSGNFQEQGQFSVNGQRPDANYFMVDGVGANFGVSAGISLVQSAGGSLPSASATGGTNNLVSVDALQEFRIQTSTYAPEFGRSPGAQVSIVTRSGTNQFSGTLFEYFRNEALDANDFFANSRGLKRPPIRQHDFGGVIGGPLFLPRFGEGGPGFYNGKDRTFFFFSYEGLRLKQPQVRITQVPSLATRASAPAAIQPFLNAFPVPNGRDLGNGLAEFNSSFANPTSLDTTSIRIDHTVSPSLTLFGRYNEAPSEVIARGGSTGTYSLSVLQPAQYKTQTFTAGVTSIISKSLTNEFRFNYSRNRGASFLSLDNFGGAVVPPDSLLFPPTSSPQDSLFGFFVLSGATTTLFAGKNVDNLQRQINLINNLSIIKGSHALKLGVDYRRLSPKFGPRDYAQLALFLNVDQVLTQRAVQAQIEQNETATFSFTNLSLFGQDTWRITPRLTLTYGLRWEYNPPPSGQDGKDLLAVTGFDNLAALALAPRGTPLFQATYNNFAPRFGVSYQLSQAAGRETVLRGGVGIFYDLNTQQVGGAISGATFPFGSSKVLSNVIFPLTPDLAAPAPIGLSRPINVTAFDPDLVLPRTYQWNFAVEQSLGSNQTITASYVGAAGRRLIQMKQIRNPNLDFGIVRLVGNPASSDYRALQMQFQRRLTQGLQALASYTWSRSTDTASSDSPNAVIPASGLEQNQERGPSAFDVRHSFTTAVTYNILAPKLGAFGSAVLRNWSVDALFRARTATPVNVTTPVVLFGLAGSTRPNLIPDIPLYIEDPLAPGGRRFNNAPPTAAQVAAAGCVPLTATNAKGAFCTPPTGQQGTLGRNALRGFGAWQLDLALRRQFNLTEKVNLQLRAEAFNLFNNPNFANPVSQLNNAQFGISTSMLGRSLGSGGTTGGFSPLYQIGGPRSMQLAIKLNF